MPCIRLVVVVFVSSVVIVRMPQSLFPRDRLAPASFTNDVPARPVYWHFGGWKEVSVSRILRYKLIMDQSELDRFVYFLAGVYLAASP